MSYARQDSTMKRLQQDSLKRLDRLADQNGSRLKRLWIDHRSRLQAAIHSAYKLAAPSGQWASPSFNRVKAYLQTSIRSIMQQLHAESVPLVKSAVRHIHRESVLLHAWALDQVTPENIKIALPATKSLREADIIDDPTAFEERWASWLDAYNSALIHNLTLNAINGGSISNAVDEVDATKANSPSYTLINALNRIYDFEVASAINQGAQDVANLNGDAVEQEIWRTRGDMRVCDDCDANDGESTEDVGFPPLHPNCHCFTQIVPESFADLLRSGDASDWDLAADMDYAGIVPNSMVVRDADGSMAAKAVVSFDSWSKGLGLAVMGQ